MLQISGDSSNNYSLTVFVKVSDIYGVITIQKTSVIVQPTPLDVSAVNEFAGAVDSDFESGDFAKGAGMLKLCTSISSCPINSNVVSRVPIKIVSSTKL